MLINKKNLPLFIGFGMPVLMVLLVMLSIYLPRLYFQPTYDFLYSNSQDYYMYGSFSVQNNHIVQVTPAFQVVPYKEPDVPTTLPLLYIHNVTTNESKEITFAEAQKLELISDKQSPDGYTIVSGNSNNSFLFFGGGGSYNDSYITGHSFFSKKLNTVSNEYTRYNPIEFIGWIKK